LIGVRKYLKISVPLSVDSEVLVAEKSLEWLSLAEGVVFDCDGVLVDSRQSYGESVVQAVDYILGRLGLKLDRNELDACVDEIKSTGHYNNSVEVARLLLLLAFLGLPDKEARILGGASLAAASKMQGPSPVELLEAVASKINLGGLKVIPPRFGEIVGSVDVGPSHRTDFRKLAEEAFASYAAKKGLGREFEAYSAFVGAAGAYGRSLVETVFSDIYYGELVSQFKKGGPYFNFGAGLYRRETRSVKSETLRRLAEIYGAERLAIVAGRNRLTAQLALGDLYPHFNDRASVFIADEIMGGAPPTIQKPSPYGIIKSATDMGLPILIYVGDSAEDALMAENASSFGVKTFFVGVTGLTSNPTRTKNMFASMGADAIVESVDSLPFLVEEAKHTYSSR